ncbi:MAG: synthase subunit [Frankiales bacterium]|jgi:F-type H+-transporting ATPase subunit b|nr:synthase subunit [Frankiales bacterium]
MASFTSTAVLDKIAVLATEAGEEPNPLVPHLSELVVGLVAFTLLFLFLRAKVWPVFEKAFAERTAAIEGGLAEAKREREEASALLAQYKEQLAEARNEAGRIRTEAQAQRAQIVEEARAEARVEASRITEAATAQIASERQQVVAELRREVGGLAVQLAGRIVGESLEDEARQRRTVERFLENLDGQSAVTDPATAR